LTSSFSFAVAAMRKYNKRVAGINNTCSYDFDRVKLPPLSYSPQSAAFHLRDSNHRCHGALPRDGLLIAILRGRIETWKEEVDRNLSWLNQLVRNCCFKWVVGLAESAKTPLTPALSQGERGLVHGCTIASDGHGFDPPPIR